MEANSYQFSIVNITLESNLLTSSSSSRLLVLVPAISKKKKKTLYLAVEPKTLRYFMNKILFIGGWCNTLKIVLTLFKHILMINPPN